MKFLHLVWAGIWRKPGRAILTLASIVNAFLIFGLLQGLSTGIDNVARESNAAVLMTFSRVSQIEPLPMGHAAQIRAVPGVELVNLNQPAVGLMSNYFRALPAYRRELQKNELEAAEKAGIDALVAVYHADHRELCAHERDYPFRIMNVLEIVGASMGLARDDQFKRLKKLQDVEAIMADCADLIAQNGLDIATTRQSVQAMLDEQPLPLRGGARGERKTETTEPRAIE